MPTKIKDNTKASGRDMFQTPHYGTRLLLPFLKPNTMIWEPACGSGRMAEVFESQHAIWTSDVKASDATMEVFDFLNQTKNDVWMQQIDYIATNPPFGHKREFYQKCMYYFRQCGTPFALLIPADYSGWVIKAVHEDMCQKIIPTRRIDYITPSGLDGAGGHTSNFHSLWLVKGFNIEIPRPVLPSEIYVNLSLKSKKEDI